MLPRPSQRDKNKSWNISISNLLQTSMPKTSWDLFKLYINLQFLIIWANQYLLILQLWTPKQYSELQRVDKHMDTGMFRSQRHPRWTPSLVSVACFLPPAGLLSQETRAPSQEKVSKNNFFGSLRTATATRRSSFAPYLAWLLTWWIKATFYLAETYTVRETSVLKSHPTNGQGYAVFVCDLFHLNVF